MTITDLTKFPAPWFGAKRDAAPTIWAALGDIAHYAEPFCGTAASLFGRTGCDTLEALLLRPHMSNRTYYSETINDQDGLVTNFLRAIKFSPDATAEAASWYVNELDIMARHLAILAWVKAGNVERLAASIDYHDAEIAGWWIYGLSCWIGAGWCSGEGPWVVGADGRITKRPKEGVARQLPHIGNDGRGAVHAGTREPGVARQRPHIANDGHGAARPQLREPGVAVGNGAYDDDAECGLIVPDDLAFHPLVMPELRRWFAFLSARLRHVRVMTGDWRRLCTTGALKTLPCRQGKGYCGVFLDPPYSVETDRAMGLYNHDSGHIAHDVRQWCVENDQQPWLRIVLAGFDTEHTELEARGWRAVEWFKTGWLKGGMGQQGAEGHDQRRERLWLSPSCLNVRLDALPMFADGDDDDDY